MQITIQLDKGTIVVDREKNNDKLGVPQNKTKTLQKK